MAACGQQHPRAPSAESILDRGPTATLHAELRIDGYEADLVWTWGVAEATDGTLAVPQPQDNEVRLYSTAGALLGMLGGPGEGPGEVRQITSVAWRGATRWWSMTGANAG